VICVILASGGRFASFFGRAHDGCKPPQHASNMIGMSMRLERLRFSFIEEKSVFRRLREHFPIHWIPVGRRKCDQTKR
jgi:hypothetical protein